MMDHEWCIAHQAVERYLLGELSDGERADFERHFFECEDCAEEVRAGFRFGENARSIFGAEAQRAHHVQSAGKRAGRRWSPLHAWAPMAACLAVAALAGYQNLLVIPQLRARAALLDQPVVLDPPLVVMPATRGAAPSITPSAGRPFIPISLAIGAAPPAQRYQCDVSSEDGKTVLPIPIDHIEAGKDLIFAIPAANLPAGRYEAVLKTISGGRSTEIERYRFTVNPR